MGVVVSLDEGKKQAGIKPMVDLTAADMARVNELILSKAGSDVEMIPEVANHLINSGGKRLRPMLTLAAAQMFGYQGDGHVKLATSVEFMHTATLLHDDVVDESGMRRGKRTARINHRDVIPRLQRHRNNALRDVNGSDNHQPQRRIIDMHEFIAMNTRLVKPESLIQNSRQRIISRSGSGNHPLLAAVYSGNHSNRPAPVPGLLQGIKQIALHCPSGST